MSSLPTINPIRFHVSLNVTDLERSVRFYEILFDQPPAKRRSDYAKFEPNSPPLVISLEPNGKVGPGSLNHLGVRLADARQLVALQERLERSGIRSEREEGVECCYAKQTKFWIHDPDNTLWEFYTLEDDSLEVKGKGQSLDVMMSSSLPDELITWEHRLGEDFPARIDACDGSLDQVTLRGTFNIPMNAAQRSNIWNECCRAVRPGGRILVRILAGSKTHESPTLPGKGAAVRFVPAKDDVMASLAENGLIGLRLLKYDDPPCFELDGIAMRETHIEAFVPGKQS